MAKTLADMTAEERAECKGMWCDVKGFTRPTLIIQMWGEEVELLVTDSLRGHIAETYEFEQVTPRHDLPRWGTNYGEPVDGAWERSTAELPTNDYKSTYTQHYRRWVGEWEQTEAPKRVNGMVNPHV